MKRLVIIILAFAASRSAADYSGIWNGKGIEQSARYAEGVPHTVQATFVQAGSSLKGTIKLGNGAPMAIKVGTVSGSAMSFSATTAGEMVTGQFSASGAQLTGRLTLSDGQVISVALTKH